MAGLKSDKPTQHDKTVDKILGFFKDRDVVEFTFNEEEIKLKTYRKRTN